MFITVGAAVFKVATVVMPTILGRGGYTLPSKNIVVHFPYNTRVLYTFHSYRVQIKCLRILFLSVA